MEFNQRSMRGRSLKVQGRLVLVGVKYSAEISSTALIWALNHVVQTGDCVKLLVVVPPHTSKKLWGFPRFRSECKAGHGLSFSGTIFDQKEHVTDSCTQMMLGLHQFYDPDKITVKIRVVSGSQPGTVAAEAKRDPTHWVILDKSMKKEAKWCAEQLDCNVVVMKKSGPKVLRLNMTESYDAETAGLSGQNAFVSHLKMMSDRWNATQVPNVTPVGSPEHSAFTSTDIGTPSSLSSLDPGSSPNLMSEIDRLLNKDSSSFSREIASFDQSDSDRDFENLNSSTSLSSHQWVADILSSAHEYSKSTKRCSLDFGEMPNLKLNSFLAQLSEVDAEPEVGAHEERPEVVEKTNVREIVSLTTRSPAEPPPLCSTCQHKAPVFGQPPKQFKFAELDHATNGFSQANFLAEGGYGCVHRGILPDGQVVAVKQRKMASTQGDQEFCSEVEVLSYAQHRNVVLLIGYCAEDGRRLLVYEYICNGSLDAHLYGRKECPPLDWSARHKIAVGAARGLRYLHEECRVGCIVHRDLRPNNILLTHDFEPLVGDFGLARWQPDGNSGVDTRVIGTFGYVAPEYAQSGQVTEKTDVYAFGIILIELVSGRKAVDLSRPRGQQFLLDWARPLLKEIVTSNLIDPIIANCHSEKEVLSMLRCASLCIERDPDLRPRMSQVLHMLEGGDDLLYNISKSSSKEEEAREPLANILIPVAIGSH